MAYASIDDNMPEHAKVERLSDRAFRVYITSICFCARNLTDGLILRTQAPKVGAVPKIIKELTDARCWDDDAEGWRVHDYLEWNKSRNQVLAFREKQKAAGLASGLARGSTNGSTKREPLVEPKPQPSKTKASIEAAAAAAREAGNEPVVPDDFIRCIRAYDGLRGTAASTPPIQRQIQDWLDKAASPLRAEWFEKACDEAAKNEVRKLSYVFGVLKRYERDGTTARQTDGKNAALIKEFTR